MKYKFSKFAPTAVTQWKIMQITHTKENVAMADELCHITTTDSVHTLQPCTAVVMQRCGYSHVCKLLTRYTEDTVYRWLEAKVSRPRPRPRPVVFKIKARAKATIFCPRAVLKVEDSPRGWPQSEDSPREPHLWLVLTTQHAQCHSLLSYGSFFTTWLKDYNNQLRNT